MSSNSKPNRLQRDPKSSAKGHSGSSSSSNSHKPKPHQPQQPVSTRITINVLPGAALNVFVAAPPQAPRAVGGAGKQAATRGPLPSGSGQGKKPAQQGKNPAHQGKKPAQQGKKPGQEGTAVMKTFPPVAANKKK